ncbi:hypothetical protein ACFE04_001709 [Oxalis oulophora]
MEREELNSIFLPEPTYTWRAISAYPYPLGGWGWERLLYEEFVEDAVLYNYPPLLTNDSKVDEPQNVNKVFEEGDEVVSCDTTHLQSRSSDSKDEALRPTSSHNSEVDDVRKKMNGKMTLEKKTIMYFLLFAFNKFDEISSALMEKFVDDKILPKSISRSDFPKALCKGYVDLENLKSYMKNILANSKDVSSYLFKVHYLNEMGLRTLCCPLKSMKITLNSNVIELMILK